MDEGLLTTQVRGGTNDDSGITVTDGVAHWYAPGALPPRRARPLNDLEQSLALVISRVAASATATGEVELGGRSFHAAELELMSNLSRSDIAAIRELNEAAAVAYLRSWTVRRVVDGATVDAAVPVTLDDLLDLPRETYDDLMAASAAINQANRRAQEGFTPAGAGDPESPTVASEP